MHSFFDRPIEFLKGVGPQRAESLQKELHIFTFGDFLQHYPFRHEDRGKFYKIKELNSDMPYIQIVGTFKSFKTIGIGKKSRLTGTFCDDTGMIELIWFKSISWIKKSLSIGIDYVVFGKITLFKGIPNIVHPEIEARTEKNVEREYLTPIYHTTESLKKKRMATKFFEQTMKSLLIETVHHIEETLSEKLILQFQLIDKKTAIIAIHFPRSIDQLLQAKNRLKFEELFYVQLQLIKFKITRTSKFKGFIFNKSDYLNTYFEKYLPFELTGAQKRVVKEIYADIRSGHQMNRLVQGDVGSGKTIVAFLSMLIATGSGFQCAFMNPTEILAHQHFKELQIQTKSLGIHVAKLTGSTSVSERKIIHEGLNSEAITILVGTHALLQDKVKFKKLGMVVVDEQHRFGVAQRAKLWMKTKGIYPHVLVMTATPIPRTLAMTLYGDLDISVIDELPKGRKLIHTKHFRESKRLTMFGFVEKEIQTGKQAYIVYPLIEESDTLDYKDLMDGYESISRRFPTYQISIIHGKMKAEDKDFEMQRFIKRETQIMVATTVIEVGVNVPNATVIVIENAERFGLSQLHQLRGRVGRGSDQSHCVLMTGNKLSNEARTRIKTMVDTTDGFKIAEVDLKLRGPGDIMGTRQSGTLELLISDLVKDEKILKMARSAAQDILREDPNLEKQEHQMIKKYVDSFDENAVIWGKVS